MRTEELNVKTPEQRPTVGILADIYQVRKRRCERAIRAGASASPDQKDLLEIELLQAELDWEREKAKDGRT